MGTEEEKNKPSNKLEAFLKSEDFRWGITRFFVDILILSPFKKTIR